MASHLQVLMRSLTRKQTFEVSLLPSNGVLSPSIDKKFDEETNLWRFSLHLRYRPNTTKTSFEIWTSETRGGCLPFSKYQHLVKEDGLRTAIHSPESTSSISTGVYLLIPRRMRQRDQVMQRFYQLQHLRSAQNSGIL